MHEALTCSSEDSITDIAKKLKENKERRIFVVDSEGMLKGIITTTDLVYKALVEDGKNLKAQDVMTAQVEKVDISDDLNKALEIMDKLKSFTCPVTDKNKLVGLVTYHDLVGYVLSSIKK